MSFCPYFGVWDGERIFRQIFSTTKNCGFRASAMRKGAKGRNILVENEVAETHQRLCCGVWLCMYIRQLGMSGRYDDTSDDSVPIICLVLSLCGRFVVVNMG